MMIPACDVCNLSEAQAELTPFNLTFGDANRRGEVCPDHGKGFTELLILLPERPKRKRTRFEDSIVASPDDIPKIEREHETGGDQPRA